MGSNGSRAADYLSIAVGTPITGRPPHRTVRAAFLHTAPTSDGCRLASAFRTRSGVGDTLSRHCVRHVRHRFAFSLASALRSTASAAGRPALFAASLLLWRSLTPHARASSASVPHLPDADQSALQPVAGHETSQVPTRSFRT